MHPVPLDELNAYFGEGNWRKLPDETFKKLRFEPASYTVEEHTVEVYVGTGGDHQDEFICEFPPVIPYLSGTRPERSAALASDNV